jgi:uncharacterized repeat protein (TIGR01451 family)
MRKLVLILLGLACSGVDARAQQLTTDVEAIRVSAVGDAWTAVSFRNSYTSAVPSCVYNLASRTNDAAIARIRNVTSTGMDIRAQLWEPTGAVTPSDVHCLIVEEGVQTLPGGQVLEARRVLSDGTVGLSIGWTLSEYENVTATFTQTFTDLIVMGSVMTANDPEPSTLSVRNGNNRNQRPNSNSFYAGKHIGQITGTRVDETLGLIATSPGSGTANDVDYLFGATGNTVQGVGTNTPPWSTTISGDYDTGAVLQNAENGGQGGFAVLYGTDPLPNNRIDLAIDEETFEGDTSRTHIAEEVAYGLFADNQTADLEGAKAVDVLNAQSGFAIPGDTVDYTLSVENTGSAPVDGLSLFIVDPIPTDVTLFTGDIGAPGSGPVTFTDINSGLTLTPGTDIGYATGTTPPATFADCGATPAGPYDPLIRFLCLRPGGELKAGTLEATTPRAEFTFRVSIN